MKKLIKGLVLAVLLLLPTIAVAATLEARLSWTDNSTNEDKFNVERSNSPTGTFANVGSVLANVVTFTNIGLVANTQYCYRVNAENTVGVSGYSNTACITTPALPNGVPSNVIVTITVTP